MVQLGDYEMRATGDYKMPTCVSGCQEDFGTSSEERVVQRALPLIGDLQSTRLNLVGLDDNFVSEHVNQLVAVDNPFEPSRCRDLFVQQ